MRLEKRGRVVKALRFEGDGGSDPADFSPGEIKHPAIKLQGVWKTEERRPLEVWG